MSQKYFLRSQDYEPVELLRYAVDHKNAAMLLFAKSFDYHDSAAYLAHLSVELCLKALLLECTDRFPDSHNLALLSADLRTAGVDLQWSASEQRALHLIGDDWDVRYPHPSSPKPVGHSHRDALALLWARLSDKIPTGLRELLEAMPRNQKGGRILMTKRVTPATNDS